MREERPPVYQAKSYHKAGKYHNFGELVWLMDCPHCETIRGHASYENAVTHMDTHFFHIHPEAHIPLLDFQSRDRIRSMFASFRMRGYSGVATIREAHGR